MLEKKLAVEIIPKQSRDLPIEIASFVYSFCSLETSVSLRQASSFWYNAYKASDHVLMLNLRKRNPWMKPEGQMATFGDCVLVFCARFKTWKTCRFWQFPEWDRLEETGSTIVVAEGMKYREKLPCDFEPVDPGCTSCRIHHEYLDLSTMEVERENKEIRIIRQSQDKTEISCAGIELTLPGKISGFKECIVGQSSIVVKTLDGGDFLFSRDKPSIAILLPKTERLPSGETGGVFVLKEYPPNRDSVGLLNRHTGKLHACPKIRQILCAVYNGCVWWEVDKKTFIPTFFDLQGGQKWYYSLVKSITIQYDISLFSTRQCGRFIVSHSPRGRYFFDLEKLTITDVQHPYDHDEGCKYGSIFGGHVDGRFVAKAVPKEVYRRYQTEGVPKLA